jgi:WD40 repeat protein
MYKDLPTTADMDEPWANHLKRLENEPYFPIVGAYVQGDFIVYATHNKQLLKMRHSAEKPDEIGKFSFLICPFHSGEVTGIQTCLKRQMIVTSGLDRSLRVWSYNTSNSNVIKLEIIERTHDEVLSIALHASGNYFIAAFNAHINCYNIFPKEIQIFNKLEIKTCKEMKFS